MVLVHWYLQLSNPEPDSRQLGDILIEISGNRPWSNSLLLKLRLECNVNPSLRLEAYSWIDDVEEAKKKFPTDFLLCIYATETWRIKEITKKNKLYVLSRSGEPFYPSHSLAYSASTRTVRMSMHMHTDRRTSIYIATSRILLSFPFYIIYLFTCIILTKF